MNRHRMSPIDAAWLHMDRPDNRMIVTSVMWFDEQLDWGAVREVLRSRLLRRYPRFTQRVVEVPALAWWVDADEQFDLEDHLHHVRLPAPGGKRELQAFVSSLQHHHLPLYRPLWELHLVDGYRDGGSAIVARIHHCIADGIALSRVLMSLTDAPTQTEHERTRVAGHHATLISEVETLIGAIIHPSRIEEMVGEGAAVARALGTLIALPPDRHTSLRGKADLYKRAMWSEPYSLLAVRDAAHDAGVTVNDLVLAAVSGALRAYLAREDGEAADIHAILPVNLRPLTEPLSPDLGNRFGLAFLRLPVGVDQRERRLQEVARRMNEVKRSPEGPVSLAVLDLVGRTPYSVEQSFVDIFADKGTAVITNVPGPRQPVFLAGRRLRGTVGWPPESGNLGLGISVISYDDELIIGLLADEGLVHNAEDVLTSITAELDALLDLNRSEVPADKDVIPSAG
jgi:diacylglycerol O-acyltransferase / wax synthase